MTVASAGAAPLAAVIAAVACAVAVLAAVGVLCGRKGSSAGDARAGTTQRIGSQLPSQRDRSLWCQSIMHAACKLANQTVHLGSSPEKHGLPVMHLDQYPSGLPCAIGPCAEMLAIGRDEENSSQGATEGECCLRSAHLVFHGAYTSRALQPPTSPKRVDEEPVVRLSKHIIILSKPCDGVSATLWSVTGNTVDTAGRGHIEGFYNAATGRVVWTGSSRQGAIVAGRSVQSVFYGQLSLIDGANGGGGALGAAPPDFAEQQKSLLAKQPVWLLHGCWVSENSLTGSLLSFTDATLTPKLATPRRLAWREMGDSVTTAKRALKQGRFQLQRLHLYDMPTSDELASTASRLDSTQQSAHMTQARFFLLNASPREPEITELLAEIDEALDDAPSAVESGSASAVSVSDVSASVNPARLRTGSSSYNPGGHDGVGVRAASPATAQRSLAARSTSLGSIV